MLYGVAPVMIFGFICTLSMCLLLCPSGLYVIRFKLPFPIFFVFGIELFIYISFVLLCYAWMSAGIIPVELLGLSWAT